MKYINILGRLLAATGSIVFTLLIITLAIVLWATAIFGGSISIKINNPFWDNTEVTE